MSGQHVVYGFLRPFLRWAIPDHDVVLLHLQSEHPPEDLFSSGMGSIPVTNRCRNWLFRSVWEAGKLPTVIKAGQFDVVLNISGAISPRCPVPQVVLCMNPWCYRPSAQRNMLDRAKAALQCLAYRRAYRQAASLIYLSGHLRELYRHDNSPVVERSYSVSLVGLSEETVYAAREAEGTPRRPWSILSVSAMASWKGAETLVQAVAILRQRGFPVTLDLVGPWPQPDYEAQIRAQVSCLELQDAVHFRGKVSRDDLHKAYAESQVFCLMSTCESFGIPAAEAMCFGTPVVSTDCCAIAEVCESAGLFGPPDDPVWTADALQRMLTDTAFREQCSENAIRRAERLTWERCSLAFRRIMDVGKDSSGRTPAEVQNNDLSQTETTVR
ncbi:MAG: glycosyltransferase family 4 protein [Planctomycetaceae bacterium]|nr:glycosyltransferase family 4 protein [Planctomycetaceae bacterium]MCA9086522.1 glycosyltransferase family 4 protein [Planctomycetaceae bacterium]